MSRLLHLSMVICLVLLRHSNEAPVGGRSAIGGATAPSLYARLHANTRDEPAVEYTWNRTARGDDEHNQNCCGGQFHEKTGSEYPLTLTSEPREVAIYGTAILVCLVSTREMSNRG